MRHAAVCSPRSHSGAVLSLSLCCASYLSWGSADRVGARERRATDSQTDRQLPCTVACSWHSCHKACIASESIQLGKRIGPLLCCILSAWRRFAFQGGAVSSIGKLLLGPLYTYIYLLLYFYLIPSAVGLNTYIVLQDQTAVQGFSGQRIFHRLRMSTD